MRTMRWTALTIAVVLLASATRAAAAEDGYVGLQIKTNPDGPGLVIQVVLKDSPAEKAGIKADDILTKLEGKEVKELPAFVSKVRQTKPGDTLTLTVERRGKEMEFKVTVGKLPEKIDG